MKNLSSSDQVVVITGASSGIGRAAAHMLAQQGMRLVLAARQPDSLEEAAAECRSMGASHVLAVPTDVTQPHEVEALMEKTVAAFGRLDVWINNAGVAALGRFEELPPEVFRQVIETNFFGCVYGSRVALAMFRHQGKGVNFDGMLASLNVATPGSVIVLHACCHNPTGYDLTPAQWQQVVEVIQSRGLVPFLDMAYQGFGEGITEDGAVIAQFVKAGLNFFVATSFSKSFSLYGERVGALSVVCGDKDETQRVLSQLKVIIRTNYSNPPTHGAQVVATVLNTPDLRAQWEQELGGMRQRIKAMRKELVTRLQAAGLRQDINFITQQKGMFSYSGLNAPQMQRLRNDYGVYGVDSGRICVAALNLKNIDAVVQAIAQVSEGGL